VNATLQTKIQSAVKPAHSKFVELCRVAFADVTSFQFVNQGCEMKIAIASDHAGFAEKECLKPLLTELGIQFEDLGTGSEASVDYPDYARKVGDEVRSGHVEQGLLVCGSGTGMAIAANKVPGVRAAVAWNEETARLAREHNDANVLALGARTTPEGTLPGIVCAWFAAEFDAGRHERRVEKITEIEKEELGSAALR
jgi:ribose 5-phosphate isomerase B